MPPVWFWIDIIQIYAKVQSKTEMHFKMIKTVKYFSINVCNFSCFVRLFEFTLHMLCGT